MWQYIKLKDSSKGKIILTLLFVLGMIFILSSCGNQNSGSS